MSEPIEMQCEIPLSEYSRLSRAVGFLHGALEGISCMTDSDDARLAADTALKRFRRNYILDASVNRRLESAVWTIPKINRYCRTANTTCEFGTKLANLRGQVGHGLRGGRSCSL